MFAAGQSLREQARWLDENHDLVIGLFDKMEDRVIGAHGIHVEPQPLDLEGIFIPISPGNFRRSGLNGPCVLR